MKHVRAYLLILCVLLYWSITAQQLTPPIQNFSSSDYKAGSQNWDIKVDDKGIIYAANNKGLLSYDGQRWELFPLKSGSIVRSVLPYNGKIFTGSYREFGCWEKDNKGEMFYTSLIPLLDDHVLQSEEFWQILVHNGNIYFRSFAAVYKYDGTSIKPIKRVVSNRIGIYNDRLVVAVGRQGLSYFKDDGELEPLPNQEILSGKTVLDMATYGGSLLIGVRDGLYVFDGESIQAFKDNKLIREIQKLELNHIMKISDDELIIGTVKNGILRYNEITGEISNYNRVLGIQNNTILSMAYKNGKIWLGLDNGIDAIAPHSPITFYTDDSGELGSVYDLAFHNDEIYLASNTGVYKIQNDEIKLIRGAEGHSWNLEVYDNVLYSNHNSGTFKVENDVFVPVDNRTGSFEIVKFDEHKSLIANYTGIDLYDDQINTILPLNEVNFPVKQLLFENQNTIWAADAYEGIYRMGISSLGDSITSIKKVSAEKNSGNFNARIFKVNNQIVVLTNEKWYKYNVFTDSLELLTEWEEFNNNSLLAEDEGFFWFMNSVDNTLRITDFGENELIVSSQMLENRTVKDHEKLIKQNDSTFYITLHDGFAKINLKELYSFKDRQYLSKPLIQRVSDIEKTYDLTGVPQISRKNAREVTILAGLPVSDATEMEYELTGADNETVKGKVIDGIIRFQNLPHDEYELKLRAINPQQSASVFTTLQFIVDPPWYLKNTMKFAYVLFLLGIIGLTFWINKLKLQKHRKLLREKYQKEHEDRMHHLEKDRLINEINMKRKELANSTMMAARKNEVLMEIQGELAKNQNKFSNEYRLKHIMSKINRAIKDKDEWKVFETNFNELHEDFFRDLLAKYPNLSNKDLKLCSYLKMNLSSKEIAPLMGISVRGVEVHRYRLRKKMNLESSENLTNFLIANL